MKLQAINGNVLVETQLVDNETSTGLKIDTSFSPERYASRSGIVVSVPKEADNPEHDIELVPGDIVFFHYLSVQNAQLKNAMFPSTNGHIIPIKNSMIHAKVSEDGDISAINNSVLIEPMENPVHNFQGIEFYIPPHKLQSKITYRGRVKYISKNKTPVRDKFKVGDVVVFRKYSDQPIHIPNVKKKIDENLMRISDRSHIFGIEQ